jgi:Tfp pilus assembly protein PilV
MKKNRNILKAKLGFTLAEVLASMIIGSMVLISVLTVYNRAERTASSVTQTLTNARNPYEALQLIAEDLDKVTGDKSDTNFLVINRYINNYAAALLAVQVHYQDPTDKQQQYETLIWQCNSNPEGDTNNMVLYRSCEGIVPEDKLLDKDKDKSEKSAYVPICSGVTFFQMKIYTGKDEPIDVIPGGMPLGIIVTISFAKPFKNSDGHYEVPDNEKYTRTIAINRSRKIKFDVTETETGETANTNTQGGDANTAAAGAKKAARGGIITNTETEANRTGTKTR